MAPATPESRVAVDRRDRIGTAVERIVRLRGAWETGGAFRNSKRFETGFSFFFVVESEASDKTMRPHQREFKKSFLFLSLSFFLRKLASRAPWLASARGSRALAVYAPRPLGNVRDETERFPDSSGDEDDEGDCGDDAAAAPLARFLAGRHRCSKARASAVSLNLLRLLFAALQCSSIV